MDEFWPGMLAGVLVGRVVLRLLMVATRAPRATVAAIVRPTPAEVDEVIRSANAILVKAAKGADNAAEQSGSGRHDSATGSDPLP
jgi:hypothetical protein